MPTSQDTTAITSTIKDASKREREKKKKSETKEQQQVKRWNERKTELFVQRRRYNLFFR